MSYCILARGGTAKHNTAVIPFRTKANQYQPTYRFTVDEPVEEIADGHNG
jgi:hypothetical protein